jgi:hypothetical protein
MKQKRNDGWISWYEPSLIDLWFQKNIKFMIFFNLYEYDLHVQIGRDD